MSNNEAHEMVATNIRLNRPEYLKSLCQLLFPERDVKVEENNRDSLFGIYTAWLFLKSENHMICIDFNVDDSS